MSKKDPSLKELRRLAEEGRCLNCGRKPVVLLPLYVRETFWLVKAMKKRFGEEEGQWFIRNGGVCIDCWHVE